MTTLLVALLGIMLLPLFTATWRTSLVMLGGQGLMMAWIVSRQASGPLHAGDWLSLFDLGLLRGFAAPVMLYRVLRARHAPRRHDMIPPNLLFWTLTVTAVLLAFECAKGLIAQPGDPRLLAAVTGTGVLLGLLVLASQSNPLSQIIGVLRIENAIALFDLGLHEHAPLAVQLGQVAIYATTIGLYRWYLAVLAEKPEPQHDVANEEPTL